MPAWRPKPSTLSISTSDLYFARLTAGLEGRSPASDVLRELFEIIQDRVPCQAISQFFLVGILDFIDQKEDPIAFPRKPVRTAQKSQNSRTFANANAEPGLL